MAFYLIDYENVNVEGFNGLTSLTENDTVVVFYSENASTLTFGLHRRLNETKAELQFRNVMVGTKNALDFQLATYLGYLIRDTENAAEETFYIVTHDSGFKILSQYWEKSHIKVKIVPDLTEKASKPVATQANIPKNEEIKNIIKDLLSEDELESAVDIIANGKTKTQINVELTKKLKDGQKVSMIHKAIKKLIKNLPAK